MPTACAPTRCDGGLTSASMAIPSIRAGAPAVLLEAARGGDESAFTRLVEPHRRELQAHAYRMLGSIHDAEDALQDALLRAWRGLAKFDGRSSLRAWLYKIATNTCLDVIGRRKRRWLPFDHVAPAELGEIPGRPLVESVWVEPFPDVMLGVEDGRAAPEARYEQRESVELAFIAALQHLPANQRAVLILREVLGFSAKEVGDLLETSVASVNSALQRARKTIDERLPAQSQQETLRALGDDGLREIVERYMDAMARGDVEAVVAMLAEDAAWSMPPLATWYLGHDALRLFLEMGPLSGRFRWCHLLASANGQPAVAAYTWHEDPGCFLPFALDVLSIRDGRIEEITSFIGRSVQPGPDGSFERYPDHPIEPPQVAIFERFGLPARIEAAPG
jgi:RNA polymerase sigma-70 factor (ECF subfamily)